nr:hypothetical protein [Tanacetum cinerariifolium]
VGNLDDDLSISSSLHNLTEDDSNELSTGTSLPKGGETVTLHHAPPTTLSPPAAAAYTTSPHHLAATATLLVINTTPSPSPPGKTTAILYTTTTADASPLPSSSLPSPPHATTIYATSLPFEWVFVGSLDLSGICNNVWLLLHRDEGAFGIWKQQPKKGGLFYCSQQQTRCVCFGCNSNKGPLGSVLLSYSRNGGVRLGFLFSVRSNNKGCLFRCTTAKRGVW